MIFPFGLIVAFLMAWLPLAMVRSEDCVHVAQCGNLLKSVPTCNESDSESDNALTCIKNSCESQNVAIKQVIEVYQKVYDLICTSKQDFKNDFKGKDMCWITALACAKGHIIGDKGDATPEACYMRKHGIESCKCMGGPVCSDVLSAFFTELFAESACDGTMLMAYAITVVLATTFALSGRYF